MTRIQQLYVAGKPLNGVEAQYGGLPLVSRRIERYELAGLSRQIAAS